MNAWQTFGIAVLVQVTAISLCACLTIALLQRWAPLRHAVGVVALLLVLASPLVALLLPQPSWLSGLRAAASTDDFGTEDASPNTTLNRQPMSASAEPAFAEEESPGPSGENTEARSAPEIVPATAAAPTRRTRRWAFADIDRNTWLTWACNATGVVWLFGLLLLTRRQVFARRRIRELVTSARPAVIDPIAANEARLALGLNALPPVLVSDLAPMPMVLGCRRPRVVLPRTLVESSPVERLRDVLIHEGAHILRGDPWIHAAQHAAGVACWLHPGVRWLNGEIARSREEVCDNFVLRRTDSVEYAQTLLDLAQSYGAASGALSLLGLFTRRWTLEQRISGILGPTRIVATRTWRITPLIVAVLLGTVSVLIGGVRAEEKIASEPEQSPVAKSVPITPANDVPRYRERIGVDGVCRDQHGKRIADARVRVFRWTYVDRPALLAEMRSNAEGEFRFADLEVLSDPNQSAGTTDLAFAATADGHASVWEPISTANTGWTNLEMADNPGTISGVVTDAEGKPLANATVFAPHGLEAVPDFQCAVTDAQGRFSIGNLRVPHELITDHPNSDISKSDKSTLVTLGWLFVRHPEYALERAQFTSFAQELKIRLSQPAIIEGRVIDEVTGRPMAHAPIFAQGVTEMGGGLTRTDEAGRYRLLVTADYYNIWSEAEDRIAVAVKALKAEANKTIPNADIRMIRGGFVVGTVIDGETGQPVEPATKVPPPEKLKAGELPSASALQHPRSVAHYGPARPKTGAAVTSVPIQPDGTYRLRVAPGRNYIYVMGGKPASAYVDVAEGDEVQLDLRTGEAAAFEDDPDHLLGEKLRGRGFVHLQQKADPKALPPDTPKSKHPDTSTGRLLDKLKAQNADNKVQLTDAWAGTMKEIVELGPAAVPELIAELDATDDNMMLRCLGFVLRAIGDKRAVPALIRALPKTVLPSSSDYGLTSRDAALARFMQSHDLDEEAPQENEYYSFGRPLREVLAALHALTGQQFDRGEIYHIHLSGTAAQRQLKRDLFNRAALEWANWWEQNVPPELKDAGYGEVGLVVVQEKLVERIANYKVAQRSRGSIIESIQNFKATQSFFDLDTGRTSALPERWRNEEAIRSQADAIKAWAAGEGFDLMGTEYVDTQGKRSYAIAGIDLQAWELAPSQASGLPPVFDLNSLHAEAKPVSGVLLHRDVATAEIDPQATASFLYLTREGIPGVLFVGVEVLDDRAKRGALTMGDPLLNPVGFRKGRRLGLDELESATTP